jgi:hypothetical protein
MRVLQDERGRGGDGPLGLSVGLDKIVKLFFYLDAFVLIDMPASRHVCFRNDENCIEIVVLAGCI